MPVTEGPDPYLVSRFETQKKKKKKTDAEEEERTALHENVTTVTAVRL